MTSYFQQIVNQPIKYVNDLNVSRTSNTTLTLSAGQCRDSQNVYDIVVSSAITINAAANGVNGLDSGSFAASTWYAVHAIGDTTNTNNGAALISTSVTAPYLPYGYDVFKHVGWARSNGSTQFIVIYQKGNGNERTYYYDALVNVLNAQGSATYAAVDCASAIPSTSSVALINYTFLPATQTNVFTLRPTGSSSTTGFTGQTATVSVNAKGIVQTITNSSQSIDYITSSASDDLSLNVMGFIDYV